MFDVKFTYEPPVSEALLPLWEGAIATSVQGGPNFNAMNDEEEEW